MTQHFGTKHLENSERESCFHGSVTASLRKRFLKNVLIPPEQAIEVR